MFKSVLENQYNKCLNILADAIKKYNESLWLDDKNYQFPVWQVVYHGLYITNIYCSVAENTIVNWPKEKQDYHFLGKKPWPPYEEVIIEGSYTKEEMLEFLEFIRKIVPIYLKDIKPEERCWPFWYDESQLEFHINNLRHLQHHTAEIIERHNNFKNIQYLWQ
jgi:hypothetical protein